jgi:prolyl oligopeptidase
LPPSIVWRLDTRALRFAAVAALLAASAPARLAPPRLRYPPAPRGDVVDDYQGTRIADPYRWLESPDAPRAAAWVKAERRLTDSVLGRIPGRDAVRKRLDALSRFTRTEVPWREGGRLFFLRSGATDPQPVLCVSDGPSTAARVVLDPATISKDGSVEVGDHVVSPDGRLLAYRASRGGADLGEVHVREIASGRELPDVVHGVLTSVCFTRNGRGFFYVRPMSRAHATDTGARIEKEVRYHALGEPEDRDRVVLAWPKGARWVYVMASDDGRWALLVAEQGTESEIWALALGDPKTPGLGSAPVRLLPGVHAFHTPIEFVGDTLFLRTDLDAPRGRVVALELPAGGEGRPREVVAESKATLVDAVVAGDRLVLHELADVKSRLRMATLDGAPAGEVALPGIGAVGWPIFGRHRSTELFFSFATFTAPRVVWRADVAGGERTPFLPPDIPFDAGAYETRQVFVASKDGTKVPMFVVAKKGLARDGSHPAFLTGYGGYGATVTPDYDPALPLWLERGGVWAVANIRGGGEYGEEWHRAGMLARKQNGFDDFLAAAEWLIAERYTTAARLGIYGHSNGGLLVGAVLTQRPDLFGAAVANAGHYDMLRYPKFTVGAGWVSEYGSPDDPGAFRALVAYSPLHAVKRKTCYPATLLLAADHDDRVVPSHAYKFAAALQDAQACENPILLRVAVNASHGYASRAEQLAEKTDVFSFFFSRLSRLSP